MPLTPQENFPLLVDKRYCQSSTTTLTLTDNFWTRATDTEGYAIKETFTGKVLFRVSHSIQGVTPEKKTKWLTDAYKIPVARLKEVRTYTTAYDLYIGKGDDDRLTQFEIKYIPLHRNPLHANYQDPSTGEQSRIGVHGNWKQRAVYIYLDRGMAGGRELIAKVYRGDGKDVTFGTSEYNVEVAPGVDVAFVILVCAAMDDALQQSVDDLKEK